MAACGKPIASCSSIRPRGRCRAETDPSARRRRSLNTFGRAVLTATVLWELYERTQSTLVSRRSASRRSIPVVLLFVPAGTLVDRSDRRALADAAATTTGLDRGRASRQRVRSAPGRAVPRAAARAGLRDVDPRAGGRSLFPLIIAREQLRAPTGSARACRSSRRSSGPALAGLALKFVDRLVGLRVVAVTGLAGALYRSLPRPRAVARRRRRERAQGLARRAALHLPLAAAVARAHARHVRRAVRRVTALLPVVASDVLHVDAFGYGMLRAAQSVGAVAMAVIGGRCRRGGGPAACC